MLTNFQTSTMKFFQLMAQIDLYLLMSSPFGRIRILTIPRINDKEIGCQTFLISDLLNISIQIETLPITITILPNMGIEIVPTFDDSKFGAPKR